MLTRVASAVTFLITLALLTLISILGVLGLMETGLFGSQTGTQSVQAGFFTPQDKFLEVVLAIEFIFIGIMLCVTLIRVLLITLFLGRFYKSEYLSAWSALYHCKLGPELAVEDFWRQLYRKPTLFNALKFPDYSKTLENHLRFLSSFFEALIDTARGPRQIYYLHSAAGHWRMHRFKVRNIMLVILCIYPLLFSVPFWMLHIAWYWIALGCVGFLLLMGCAMASAYGPLEVQHRARLRALCEFFLDEGGPDPQILPPLPDIIGSPLRQRWVKWMERAARLFGWRGGIEE